MLVDRFETFDNRLVGGRSPVIDDDILEILSEDCIKVYLIYLDQLRHLFTLYYHENFNAGKKVIKWDTLANSNKMMAVSAFLKMIRCNRLMPDKVDIEPLQMFVLKIIPPQTPEEVSYLDERKMLDKLYNTETEPKTTSCNPELNEPGLRFHEFIFLLGLIAIRCMDTSELASQ